MTLPTPELGGRVLTAVFVSAAVVTVLVLVTNGGAAGAVPVGDLGADENSTSCEEVRMHVPTIVETAGGGTEEVMVLTAHCTDIDAPTGPANGQDANSQSAESVSVQRSHQSTTVRSAGERDVTVVQQQSQCTSGSDHRVQHRERRVIRSDGGDSERYEIHQEITQTEETCRAERGQSSRDGADDSVSTSNADDVDADDVDTDDADADDAEITVDVAVEGDSADVVVENESAVADEADAVAAIENE